MLPLLLNTPRSEEDWSRFSFANRTSHDKIRRALLAKGVGTGDYQLDPIAKNDLVGWLQRHAQTHIEMTAALGQRSNDLQDVDFNDEGQLAAWLNIHWLEHSNAEAAL